MRPVGVSMDVSLWLLFHMHIFVMPNQADRRSELKIRTLIFILGYVSRNSRAAGEV